MLFFYIPWKYQKTRWYGLGDLERTSARISLNISSTADFYLLNAKVAII